MSCAVRHRGSETTLTAIFRPADSTTDTAVIAQIDPEYLWNLSSYTAGAAMSVANEGLVLLDPIASPIDELSNRNDRSIFPWSVDGQEFLASSRLLFTKPMIGMNFVIVRGLPRPVIMEPVSNLGRLLLTLAAVALLSAALVGRSMIQRILGPVEELRLASQEVAAGNLDCQVSVDTADELSELGGAFNNMTQELRNAQGSLVEARDVAIEKARIQEEFIQNVSHELRTPLTGVLSATEILDMLGADDPESSREFTTLALDQSRHLRGLLDDILGYTEVRGERDDTRFSEVELQSSLQDAIEASADKSRAHRITITFEPDGQEAAILGSRLRLTEVWSRLLDNAIKFSPEGSKIKVRARCLSDEATVEIEDEGDGIPLLDREMVFDPFRQSSTDLTTDKPPGTGLGLSIVNEIIARHSGTIVIDSAKNAGTLVRVHLPATPQHSTSSEPAPVTA